MRLPAPLSHRKKDSHKNDFGHLLILAGSRRMLGAAALSSLAAMRSGAGLVTVGIPRSLNNVLQKKISPVIMTLPLPETSEASLDSVAFREIEKFPCDVLALGCGLSTEPGTKRLVLKVVEKIQKPLVIDADALNTVAAHTNVLKKTKTIKILTPHPGEMARLLKFDKDFIQKNRVPVARDFARRFNVIVLLKGHQSVVASPEGEIYINKTGNPGMATAGSGDVLTGMLAAFLAQGLPQGLSAFEMAKLACYFHGKAGDLAVQDKTMISMIASDILEKIPKAFQT